MGRLAAFRHKNNLPSALAKAEPVLRIMLQRKTILRASKKQDKWQHKKPTLTLIKTASDRHQERATQEVFWTKFNRSSKTLKRPRITFTANGKRQFVPPDHIFPICLKKDFMDLF